jgi:hypothetical protein
MELCPVCMLRQGLADGAESGDSSASEDTIKPTTPEQAVHRFEHYELVMGEDGKPVELGRGAMGITYKAFDVDLHCPVTLKVISERYLGDESVQLRFLREARAAASVRHPNVASVFHLGRTGQNYFYAMEFVEGETLENLIKRSGKLEVRPTLEERRRGRELRQTNEAFILTEGRIYSFADLADPICSLHEAIAESKKSIRERVSDWLVDPDQRRQLLWLLNQCLRQHCYENRKPACQFLAAIFLRVKRNFVPLLPRRSTLSTDSPSGFITRPASELNFSEKGFSYALSPLSFSPRTEKNRWTASQSAPLDTMDRKATEPGCAAFRAVLVASVVGRDERDQNAGRRGLGDRTGNTRIGKNDFRHRR